VKRKSTMDFEISEDDKLTREAARNFIKRVLLPLENDLLYKEAKLSKEVMDKLKKKAKEAGFWGFRIPEEFGGLGESVLCLCLVEEELAQTIIPFDFGDVTPILFHCNEEQKRKYLDPVIEGTKQYSLALLEPENPRPESLKTMAFEENGHYVIEGQKLVMQAIDIGEFVITFAVTDPGKPPREGVTCFLVDRDTPGLITSGEGEKVGWQVKLTKPIVLSFNRCKMPVENILGEIGGAFYLGAKWLPSRRIIRAARCVGVGKRLLKVCCEYAKLWEIFGRTISEQTRVQRILADMATDINAAMLMVYHAAYVADRGEDIRREAAMAKVFATEMVNRAADKTVQLHGGPANIKGLFVERLCRNAIAASFSEEALELQRAIIARDILRGISLY
jgi:acyl-CoA dehydrogenase